MSEKENLKEQAKQAGCELTDEQVKFFWIQMEKAYAFETYLREKNLEFVNGRTRKSVEDEFDIAVYDPENEEMDFKEIINSLVTDENGDIIWDLFDPKCRKKHNLTVCGDELSYVDVSKILPPSGSINIAEKSNPFAKEHWNMAKQSEIYKENPQIATYLAAAAKQTL